VLEHHPQEDLSLAHASLPERLVERELKFALPLRSLQNLGVDLSTLPCLHISQSYFPSELLPEMVEWYEQRMNLSVSSLRGIQQGRLRVSHEAGADPIYEFVLKSAREGPYLSERLEAPALRLTKEEFDVLKIFATAGTVVKDRYRVEVGEGTVGDLDVISGLGPPNAFRDFPNGSFGIATIDIEFPSRGALEHFVQSTLPETELLSSAVALADDRKLRQKLSTYRLATTGIDAKEHLKLLKKLETLTA
jgi:hypothetical protein